MDGSYVEDNSVMDAFETLVDWLMEYIPESVAAEFESALDGPNNGDIVASILAPASATDPQILRHQPGQAQCLTLAAMLTRYNDHVIDDLAASLSASRHDSTPSNGGVRLGGPLGI